MHSQKLHFSPILLLTNGHLRFGLERLIELRRILLGPWINTWIRLRKDNWLC